MEKLIIWLLTIFCVWGTLTIGLPLRNSPHEFLHLDEDESHSRPQPPRVINEESVDTTEMSVEENVRRMQGNRNR